MYEIHNKFTPTFAKALKSFLFTWFNKYNKIYLQEKKKEIWLSPMTKAPTPTEMSKGQSDNTNNATKKFD